MVVPYQIANKFLTLLDTRFPLEHELHKLLNRNTIKVSYSCMPNIKQIIAGHNRSITARSDPTETKSPNCNCKKDKVCPLNKQCLTESIVYQATVTRQDILKEETYIGLTENTFKTRYNAHTSSFKNENKRNTTTLSQYIWMLKDNKISYSLKWKIVAKSRPYSTTSKKCNLCLREKYYIICKPQMATLNNRNELATECMHKKKHLLCNLKD